MSKLGCVCGHTIMDKTDNISYKAKFIRDQDREKYWSYEDDIAAFLDAIQSGGREAWIKTYFSDSYPTQIRNSSVIFDIISRHEGELSGQIYQCENCGRVKIQVNNSNIYSSFLPEDERGKEIFRGLSTQQNGA